MTGQRAFRLEALPARPSSLGRRRDEAERALTYLYIFRRVVVGLAIIGAGVAWSQQAWWPLAACVCIGIGELLESSYYIGVIRWGQRARPAAEQSSRPVGPRTAHVAAPGNAAT